MGFVAFVLLGLAAVASPMAPASSWEERSAHLLHGGLWVIHSDMSETVAARTPERSAPLGIRRKQNRLRFPGLMSGSASRPSRPKRF